MFFHIFFYRLKSLIREREISFWIFLFPLCLATFFSLAFGDISSKTEDFQTIPVAVVLENTPEEEPFLAMMNSLSDSSENEVPFFKPTYTTLKKGTALLNKKSVEGIIILEKGIPKLNAQKNGVKATMIKTVLDRYVQNLDVAMHAGGNPQALETIFSNTNNSEITIKDHKLTNGTIDNTTDFFYALIAMACLFGSFSGQYCATQMKANLSEIGKRKTLAAAHRLTIILADTFAVLCLHALSNIVLLIYMMFVLKINLGVTFLQALIVSMVGSLIGINVGSLVGSIPKISENARIGINVVFSLVSSFFSGLMIEGIKVVIEEHVPLLNRLNPATLISNALYSLNIYDNYDKFYANIITMVIMSIVLCVVSFIISRRESYDSL